MTKRTGEAKLSQNLLGMVSAGFPVRLHFRSDLHVARKVWHAGMGLMISVIYMSGVSRGSAVMILAFFLGLNLFIETMRLTSPLFNEKVMGLWGPLMRTNEIDRISGVPFYIAATLLTFAIFPKPIAVLSLLYLAFGDPIASTFGILYGKHSVRFSNGKSLIGTGAGVLACAIASMVFLSVIGITGAPLWIIALVGGFVGGTAEMIPLDVDDNFSIPIVSGFALWLTFILLGI